MFPRVLKLINKLFPQHFTRSSYGFKVVAAFTAVILVMALIPIPKDLRSIFADPPAAVETDDIIVETATDVATTSADSSRCQQYSNEYSSAGTCRLRDAIQLANETSGANRIVFDSEISTIDLVEPITLTGSDLTILGTINDNVPQVTLEPDVVFLDLSTLYPSIGSHCTNTDNTLLPLISILGGSNTTISGLSIINAPGNAIQIVDSSLNTISNNWIGTNNRADKDLSGNGLHGVCVAINEGVANDNTISGNVIVASGNDGVRIEGKLIDPEDPDASAYEQSASGSIIENNLIGNLVGNDIAAEGYAPGNEHSGITLRMADSTDIVRNIITNNGLSDSNKGDGISLLQATNSHISENYIGATQTLPDADLENTFPFLLGEDNYIMIGSYHPGSLSDYTLAPNACDGIAIRFYDQLIADADFSPTQCPDPDLHLANTDMEAISNTPVETKSLIGPSIQNLIVNNDIGGNQRNGIFVQTLACNTAHYTSAHADRHNLPNIIYNDSAEPVYVQSVKNTFLQNSIFANDGGDGTFTSTAANSYGTGIDLEDFATAGLEHASLSDFTASYWGIHLPTDAEKAYLDCEATASAEWQPADYSSTTHDFNINENDTPSGDADAGYDIDGGANRLQNFPVIDTTGSTVNAITGTAPEGTLVELYQVACTSGGSDDVTPLAPADVRTTCDPDYYDNESDGDITDDHKFGHGQGFRFLGNAYVPTNDDADNQGTWTINPADFNASDGVTGVSSFLGGIVTATATAVEAPCWDNGTGSDNICDTTIGAAAVHGEFAAQRAGSVGAVAPWLPSGTPDSCFSDAPPLPDQVGLRGLNLDCFGSTSEFSANEFISRPNYSITKTLASPSADTTVTNGDEITYTILVTNTGNSVINFPAGSLSDPLASNISVVTDGCSWVKSGGSEPLTGSTCTGSDANAIDTTDFGSLNPGDNLNITLIVSVADDVSGALCTISNTIKINESSAEGEQAVDDYGQVATESGSVGADHSADTLIVSPCPGSNFEKQVAIGSGSFSDADTDSGTIVANRGDAVNYLIHYNNESATATGVVITDTFPSTLALADSSPDVKCWMNTTARDDDYSDDTLLPDCTYSSGSFYLDTESTPFTVAPDDTLHILITGYTLSATYPLGAHSLCNTATAETTDESAFEDAACIHVLDPTLITYKTVSVAGATETSFNTSSATTSWPTAPVGQPLKYYIDVANTGTGTSMAGIQVTDTFPSVALDDSDWTCRYLTASGTIMTDHSALTWGSASSCTVTHVSGTTATVVTGVTSLPQASALHIQLGGRTIPSLTSGTQLCNTVSVQATLMTTATDSACARVVVPGIQITKTASTSTPVPGSVVTYTLRVTNTGTFTANDVTVIDDLDDTAINNNLIPACVATFANVTALNGGVKSSATSGDTANRITWSLGSIGVGSTAEVSFRATIRNDITSSTLCRNTATADGPTVNAVDASANITVPAATITGALITITKDTTNDSGDSDNPEVFSVGDAINYHVSVHNSGGVTASGLTVRDSIPNAEEDLRNTTATAGTVNATELAAGNVDVGSMNIAADDSETINYTVSLKDDSDFPVRNYRLNRNASRDDAQFFVERVRSDSVQTDSTHNDAETALGAPDNTYVSLGDNGELILDVASRRTGSTKLIVDGDGNDFCIAEADGADDTDRATERYTVEVSQTTRSADFERIGRATGDSKCFDLEDVDMTWARYIKIIDNTNTVSGLAPGIDVDAVCLMNVGGFVTNTAGVYDSDDTLLGTVDNRVLVNMTDALENPLRERDCRSVTENAVEAPVVPPTIPVEPYIPPVITPITLPKTGPADAALPLIGGSSSLLVWWAWRRKK